MTETNHHDLRLIGTSQSNSGNFRNIRVMGEAVLHGDTVCRNLSCTGNIELKGNLHAESLKLTGNGKIQGSVRTLLIKTTGDLEVSENVRADRMKLTGDVRIAGACEAETMELKGGMSVGGLLNAERIVVTMHGPCRAKEIGGGIVSIKRSRAILVKKMFGKGAEAGLQADLIEGDNVELEYTKAAVVRGNRVTLGAGCEVGRVEYRTELNAGPGAKVREKVQI